MDWYFVDLRNKKIRTYWHERSQSVSCRVRVTKNNNATNFRKNIIHYLYNRNRVELKLVAEKLNNEDWGIIQKAFGFDELKFIKDEQLRRKAQFIKSQQVSAMEPGDVISCLGLDNVVSTKIKGYYKEIFFLRSFVYSGYTPFILRCLYHLETDDDWMPDFDEYKEEIMYLLQNI